MAGHGGGGVYGSGPILWGCDAAGCSISVDGGDTWARVRWSLGIIGQLFSAGGVELEVCGANLLNQMFARINCEKLAQALAGGTAAVIAYLSSLLYEACPLVCGAGSGLCELAISILLAAIESHFDEVEKWIEQACKNWAPIGPGPIKVNPPPLDPPFAEIADANFGIVTPHFRTPVPFAPGMGCAMCDDGEEVIEDAGLHEYTFSDQPSTGSGHLLRGPGEVGPNPSPRSPHSRDR